MIFKSNKVIGIITMSVCVVTVIGIFALATLKSMEKPKPDENIVITISPETDDEPITKETITTPTSSEIEEEDEEELEEEETEEEKEEPSMLEQIEDAYAEEAKGIIARLRQRGFTDSDECDGLRGKCMSDGTFFAGVDTRYPYVAFKKHASEEDIKTYDVTDDIDLFTYVFERESFTFIDDLNGLINNFSDNMYNVDILDKSLYIQTFFYKDQEEIAFYVSYMNEYDNEYTPQDINSILMDENNSAEEIKRMHDAAMKNNAKFFKFADYITLHLEGAMTDICSVELYNSGNHYADADYCHGGTSNVFFRFAKGKDYDAKDVKDSVVRIVVSAGYFENNYKELIKTDLAYFNKKLDKKFTMKKEKYDKIETLIESTSTEDEKIKITVNKSLSINITREPYESYPDYVIEYRFSK